MCGGGDTTAARASLAALVAAASKASKSTAGSACPDSLRDTPLNRERISATLDIVQRVVVWRYSCDKAERTLEG